MGGCNRVSTRLRRDLNRREPAGEMAAPPALRVGRAARPAPSHHKGCSAIRAQKTSPWPRPASTATGSGLFRFAMTAVAGPLPVLFPECAKQALTTSDAANRLVKHRFFGGRRPRPGGLIPAAIRARCLQTHIAISKPQHGDDWPCGSGGSRSAQAQARATQGTRAARSSA